MHKVSISYWKAWHGRKLAHDLLRGSLESSFHHLPVYCHMLKRLNPGTVTDIVVVDENQFKYIFYGFRGVHQRLSSYEKGHFG